MSEPNASLIITNSKLVRNVIKSCEIRIKHYEYMWKPPKYDEFCGKKKCLHKHAHPNEKLFIHLKVIKMIKNDSLVNNRFAIINSKLLLSKFVNQSLHRRRPEAALYRRQINLSIKVKWKMAPWLKEEVIFLNSWNNAKVLVTSRVYVIRKVANIICNLFQCMDYDI